MEIQSFEEGRLAVVIDGVTHRLDGSKPHEITTLNGSEIQLIVDPARERFNYSVSKGDVRVGIAGIPGWEAAGFPGDTIDGGTPPVSAQMAWNGSEGLVDIENTSDTTPLIVGLPAQTSARMEPGALFQFSRASGSTYSTSASGAPTTLFSRVTQSTTQLNLANLIIKSGIPTRPETSPRSTASQAVDIAWLPGSMMTVKVDGQTFSLAPGSEEALLLASGGRIDVSYNEKSEVSFKSGSGSYAVQTSSFQTWTIRVPEGQELGMSKSLNRSIFTISASPENYVTMAVQSSEGPFPLLYPGAVMNFISSRDNTLISANAGITVFYESAGEGPQRTLAFIPEPRWPSKPGTSPPPFGRLNDILDLDSLFGGPIHGAIGRPRIDQPPETGF